MCVIYLTLYYFHFFPLIMVIKSHRRIHQIRIRTTELDVDYL